MKPRPYLNLATPTTLKTTPICSVPATPLSPIGSPARPRPQSRHPRHFQHGGAAVAAGPGPVVLGGSWGFPADPGAPMGPGGFTVLLAVLSAVPGALRPAAAAAAAAASEERPASPAVATPCWRVEQFVVAQECTRCSGFEMVSAGRGRAPGTRYPCTPVPGTPCARYPGGLSLSGPSAPRWQKTIPACGPTGFIEKINCASSRRDEYKSCRSAALEAQRFWRFVGSALGVAAAAAALVVLRQRVLDRRALEKVRKQIESI
ncbi:protein JTB isoform X2 [Prinia subflava]|uniref:protein JTB isoform X2 n=1 Tax=Prinia subflava TaxID=208062 RepID=UPI002FE232C7